MKLEKAQVVEYLEVAADGTLYQVMSAPGVSPVRNVLQHGAMGIMQYTHNATAMLGRLRL